MRRVFLWAARNSWLKAHLPGLWFMRRAVRRFMPGETMDDALKAAIPLQKAGIATLSGIARDQGLTYYGMLSAGALAELGQELPPVGLVETPLDAAAATRLGQGQAVAAEPAWPVGAVRVYAEGQRFIALGAVTVEGRLEPQRVFHR